jgi:N4-(beta-N-acetylglucosaminyl)-L-asparaginase
MRRGSKPEEACLKTLEQIVEKSKRQPRLISKEGFPRFNLSFYALNKKGEYGSASIWSGGRFAVHDGEVNKLKEKAYLFKRRERR